MDKKIFGNIGENQAKRYLEDKGYKILQMNYKNAIGEIDIVAKNRGIIVFVEVKNRTSAQFGLPSEAVTYTKQNKIRKVALGYLKMIKNLEADCRFDVIDILAGEITHIIDAF